MYYLIFDVIVNVVGLYSGKNLYNNEHVAIKLVSSFYSLLMNVYVRCEFGPAIFCLPKILMHIRDPHIHFIRDIALNIAVSNMHFYAEQLDMQVN